MQTWERLIALKPYIDIVISSLNVNKDNNAKEDAKRLNKINLTNNEWDIIRDLLEILGPLAQLTEILEGTKYATMSYIYPDIIKLKSMFSPTINSNLDLETNDDAPTNTFGLLDNIKSNLYKALENYFEVIEKEALIAALLDPHKKKTMFASNDQKELAKANLHEVYELAKNDTNIHLEECEPKPKKRKTSTRVYKRRLFSDDESHDLQTEDNEV
ncbi:zinc finger BED domain-containing protein 1-like [Rhizophagus irregularis DAOM 181602=DAOM 197198]|nr:zinc finger BED domain-containing protein 1-like [Rhizophagus irregularis DAOM 181602=DAOM 197198]